MEPRFKYYDGITDDEKREMEGEIKGPYEEAKRALERERKFIEDTSHYFFNPICVAKGYLDLHLQRDMSEEARGELEAIKRAVERIERTVKNVVTRGEIHE